MWFSTDVTLIDALRAYQSRADAAQVAQAARIIDFIVSCDAPWRRSTLQGHLTASAWIVDRSGQQVLLLHHKKLDKWLQPGGHIDDEDAVLADAALREAREETGIDAFHAATAGDLQIFDVDVHPIPARGEEPAHVHYDVRVCFVASQVTTKLNLEETHAIRWFPMTHIAVDATIDPSVRRMAQLSQQLFLQQR